MADPDACVEFRDGEKYCAILCTGTFSEKLFYDLIGKIKAHREAADRTIRYLVDLRGTDYRIDSFARFRVGEGAAKQLPNLRISVLGNFGVVDKITENTAYNRGMLILVTDNAAEAVAWLEQ